MWTWHYNVKAFHKLCELDITMWRAITNFVKSETFMSESDNGLSKVSQNLWKANDKLCENDKVMSDLTKLCEAWQNYVRMTKLCLKILSFSHNCVRFSQILWEWQSPRQKNDKFCRFFSQIFSFSDKVGRKRQSWAVRCP